MPLTEEQQAQVDLQLAIENERHANQMQAHQAQVDLQLAIENARHANQMQIEATRIKLEAVRLAKETLIENARSKSVDSRNVSATDVQAFAQTLVSYING